MWISSRGLQCQCAIELSPFVVDQVIVIGRRFDYYVCLRVEQLFLRTCSWRGQCQTAFYLWADPLFFFPNQQRTPRLLSVLSFRVYFFVELRHHYSSRPTWVRWAAIRYKGLDVWLIAARRGNLELLSWARENGCAWSEGTTYNAAEAGHLDALEWAFDHGCPLSEEICTVAATEGHVDILVWARSKGCEWDEETCTSAAANGHLEGLKYAIANGCPWSQQQIVGVSDSTGNTNALEWALKNEFGGL